MIESSVLEMLKKNRSEQDIINGLTKLGYSRQEITDAITKAKASITEEKPETLMDVGKLFRHKKHKVNLDSNEISVTDKDNPVLQQETSGSWIIPVVALIVLIWIIVIVVVAFDSRLGIKNKVGNALGILHDQEDSDFLTYCVENMAGYSQQDRQTLCEMLDKTGDPRNLKFTNMNDACKKTSFDSVSIRACALQLTRLVDRFNAQANP